MCVFVFQISDASYILRICPEAGLSSQQYKCAECRKRISLSSKLSDLPRVVTNRRTNVCEVSAVGKLLTANQEVPGSVPGLVEVELWATFFRHTVRGQGR